MNPEDRRSVGSAVHLWNRLIRNVSVGKRSNCKCDHLKGVPSDLRNKCKCGLVWFGLLKGLPVILSIKTASGKSKSITASNVPGLRTRSNSSAWLFLLGNPSKQNLPFKFLILSCRRPKTSVSDAKWPVLMEWSRWRLRRRSPVEMCTASKSLDSHLDIVPLPEA